MPVYFVTGKLGSGKTLIAVRRIQEYLQQRRPVATNIDIDLNVICKPDNTTSRVVRLPDKPTADDLDKIGTAYEGDYDESKFGLVVLDELGTWLNSRSWNDKNRAKFIDWLIHARKLRWDIIMLVQNIDMVDKQVRDALCEYLVVCKRLDRLKYMGFKLPKIHSASVYYGHTEMPALLEEKWRYRGTDLYKAYDTSQAFSPFYDKGPHSVLPPGFYPSNHSEQKKGGLQMVLRSSPIFGVLMIVGVIAASAYFYFKPKGDTTTQQTASAAPSIKTTFANEFGNVTYEGFIAVGKQKTYYLLTEQYGRIDSDELKSFGGQITSMTECGVQIKWSDNSVTFARCNYERTPDKKSVFGI